MQRFLFFALIVLLPSKSLQAQTQRPRGEALPRGISEIERDTLASPASLKLTPLPEWAQQGQFTFMRMDGGVMEREKARRSTYGRSFTNEESQVLGDLYTTHADRIITLMKHASVTWVWITWSNGWSHEYEAGEWTLMRQLISKLHTAGIRVTAYLCATSMFWQNMFMDEPRSVTWLAFLPSNIKLPFGVPVDRPPYPFTPDWSPVSYGRRGTSRFIADVANPEWRSYVKVRVQAAIDAGVDAFFFDNALVGRPKAEESAGFFADIQRFIKDEKKSPALLSTHIGAWLPHTVPLNELCEVIYSGGSEPGMIDGKWRSNIATWRYQRSLVGDKPMYGEVIANFPPSGTTGIMTPKAEQIAIAEGAASQFSVANRVFGPFLKGIVLNEPKAMASWSAIGEYNRFVLAHPELYSKAKIVPDVLVVLPDQWPFDEEGGVGSLLESLVHLSVQFETCTLSRLTSGVLKKHQVVLVAGIDRLSTSQVGVLDSYRRSGGKIYSVGVANGSGLAEASSSSVVLATLHRNDEARSEFVTKLDQLLKSRKVRFDNPGHVLATVTQAGTDERAVAHFINHDVNPQTHLRVVLDLSFLGKPLKEDSIKVYSPDRGCDQVTGVSVNGGGISLTIPKLETYLVVAVTR